MLNTFSSQYLPCASKIHVHCSEMNLSYMYYFPFPLNSFVVIKTFNLGKRLAYQSLEIYKIMFTV